MKEEEESVPHNSKQASDAELKKWLFGHMSQTVSGTESEKDKISQITTTSHPETVQTNSSYWFLDSTRRRIHPTIISNV